MEGSNPKCSRHCDFALLPGPIIVPAIPKQKMNLSTMTAPHCTCPGVVTTVSLPGPPVTQARTCLTRFLSVTTTPPSATTAVSGRSMPATDSFLPQTARAAAGRATSSSWASSPVKTTGWRTAGCWRATPAPSPVSTRGPTASPWRAGTSSVRPTAPTSTRPGASHPPSLMIATKLS